MSVVALSAANNEHRRPYIISVLYCVEHDPSVYGFHFVLKASLETFYFFGASSSPNTYQDLFIWFRNKNVYNFLAFSF